MNPLTASRSAFGTLHASAPSRGVVATARLVCLRLIEVLRGERAARARLCRKLVGGKVGLETGGPSEIFAAGGLLPVYRHAAQMDNCNSANLTVWEGEIEDGEPFLPEGPKAMGVQFIREVTDLSGVADGTYDFLCSSHTLEHVAHPLRALVEWQRVLSPGSTLILLLPHKNGTFDHRRVYNPESFRKDFPSADLQIEAFGGYFMKPVSNGQIEESWSSEMVDAFPRLGERYPDMAAEIFVVAKCPV